MDTLDTNRPKKPEQSMAAAAAAAFLPHGKTAVALAKALCFGIVAPAVLSIEKE